MDKHTKSSFSTYFFGLFLFIYIFFIQSAYADNSFVCNNNLSYGSVSQEVVGLQKYLNTTDFQVAKSGVGSKGKETNIFGLLTKNALSKFQKANNITSNLGAFDLATRKYLGCIKTNTPVQITKSPIWAFEFAYDLKLGAISQDVAELQKYLNTTDFQVAKSGVGSKGRETNIFGLLTKNALSKFQKANNITSNLGVLDLATRKYLNYTKSIAGITIDSKTIDQNNYYSIGGSITGISGPVTLQNNYKDDLIIDIGDNSDFTFSTPLADGTNYNVRVKSSYLNQKCYTNNSVGIINGSNVNNIKIACGTNLLHNPFTFILLGSQMKYLVVYSADTNGTINGATSQTINSGDDTSYVTAIPNIGYHFISWSDGVLTATRSDANITSAFSVTANFAINTYEITSSASSNGSITESQIVNYGANKTFVITPSIGYRIGDVLIDGVSIGSVETYTFSNVATTHTISATFLKIISVPAITGVTAPVTGATPVSTIDDTIEYTTTITWSPADVTFAPVTEYTAIITITPKTGYTLTGVSENFFTVGGGVATNSINDGVVTVVFPETLAIPITAVGAISGTPQVESILTAGAITPAGATVNYQWKICETIDGVYENITGATNSTYTIVLGDMGKFIKLVAMGFGSYSGIQISEPTSAIESNITANLTGLVLSGSPMNYTFVESTYNYNNVSVFNSVGSITVTPTGVGSIIVNGASVISGSPSDAINLTAGATTTITISATAPGKLAITYTIDVYRQLVQVTPTFSPDSGVLTFGDTVTIISSGADAIYYTTNGDDPTISSINQATTPLVINSAVTVKALAIRSGYDDSAIGSAEYTAQVVYYSVAYPIVQIGDQYWFQKNLATTKNNDGTNVTNITGNSNWSTANVNAHSWYNNDYATYGSVYGALYNNLAAANGKICPVGWHVPTDEDFKILVEGQATLGCESGTDWQCSPAGSALKESGTTHWGSPNTGANNASGFTALGGGYRNTSGVFTSYGTYNYFWSSSANKASRLLSKDNADVYRNFSGSFNGMSIRCIRD